MQKENNNYWSIMSTYRAELMGFAALIITIMHLYVSFYEDAQLPYITPLLKRGNLGVDIFLLLSGLGLYCSMKKKPDTIGFYRKRIKRVLVPYIVLSAPYWIILDLILQKNLTQFIKDLLLISFWTDGVTHYWFVAFILPAYLLYPLVYKAQKRNANLILLFATLTVICSLMIAQFIRGYYLKVEIAITRIPVFLMGSYIGEILFDNNSERETHIFSSYCILSFFLLIMSIPFDGRNNYISTLLYRYGSAGGAAFLIVIVCFVLKRYKPIGASRILALYGGISLEIYIISQSIRNGMLELGFGLELGFEKKLLIETIVFVASTLLSCLYKRTKEKHAILCFNHKHISSEVKK